MSCTEHKIGPNSGFMGRYGLYAVYPWVAGGHPYLWSYVCLKGCGQRYTLNHIVQPCTPNMDQCATSSCCSARPLRSGSVLCLQLTRHQYGLNPCLTGLHLRIQCADLLIGFSYSQAAKLATLLIDTVSLQQTWRRNLPCKRHARAAAGHRKRLYCNPDIPHP